MSLASLFQSQPAWSSTNIYETDELREANIVGGVATLLNEVGSGDINVTEGGLYHVLDVEGVAYWSRDVLEKLQGRCQPAGLNTFFTDAGGGTYGFVCSNGVYAMHFSRGLLARFDDLKDFFSAVFAAVSQGAEPFADLAGLEAVEQTLRQADMLQESGFQHLIAGKVDADFAPYDPHIPWKKGDLMMHASQGRGIVLAVKTTMYIQVEFASGKHTLGHKGW